MTPPSSYGCAAPGLEEQTYRSSEQLSVFPSLNKFSTLLTLVTLSLIVNKVHVTTKIETVEIRVKINAANVLK